MSYQSLFYRLFFELNLFGVILVLVLNIRMILSPMILGQKYFRRFLNWQVIFFLSDSLAMLTCNSSLPIFEFLTMLLKSLYFLSCIGICCELFRYFEECRQSSWARKRRFQFWSDLPLMIDAFLILLNFRFGFLFYVDSQGMYRRGPLFTLTYYICFGYAFLSMIRSVRDALKKENYANRGYYLLLAGMPIIPIAASLVQFFIPNLPLLCPILSIFSVLIYIDAMQQLIFTDPLTGLNNRRQFLKTLVSMTGSRREGEALHFAMVDVNHFKSINDTYGHEAGDKALVILAEALTKCFERDQKKACLCRYGGDEFAVVLLSEDPEELKQRMGETAGMVETLSKEQDMPAPFTFSVGYSTWEEDDDPDQLLSRADLEMYRNKRRVHRSLGR